jgi:hypothetical protein
MAPQSVRSAGGTLHEADPRLLSTPRTPLPCEPPVLRHPPPVGVGDAHVVLVGTLEGTSRVFALAFEAQGAYVVAGTILAIEPDGRIPYLLTVAEP